MGSKSEVNNDPEESKKTTPLTHFSAPGRTLERLKKLFEGSRSRLQLPEKKFNRKKGFKMSSLNKLKINTRAKNEKMKGKKKGQKNELQNWPKVCEGSRNRDFATYFFDLFLINFCPFLDPSWGALGSHVAAKWAS